MCALLYRPVTRAAYSVPLCQLGTQCITWYTRQHTSQPLPHRRTSTCTQMCGSHNLYGWVQAVYILGQCLASLIFGAWASRRTVKEAFVITTGLMVVGNVMYAVAPTIGSPHGPCQPGGVCVVHTATQPCTLHVAAKWIVLSGRFVAGLGGGMEPERVEEWGAETKLEPHTH